MLFPEIVLLLALLLVCSFAPGFFIVRRLHWSPMEKMCGSIGLSLIFLYLGAWAIFCFCPRLEAGDGIARAASFAISAVCLLLGILARRELARLLRSVSVRQALLGFLFLLVWTVVLLAAIRHYSGARWFGDWLGHFHRAVYLMHRFPASSPLLGDDRLPARPPMMNVLTGFFLTQTEDRFELFQLVTTFLNLLVFLPCCLMLPALAISKRRRILPLVFLFAVNPVFIQNATYSWTKLLACFFVVLSFWFFLAARRKNDLPRMVACFLFSSAGLLVHYLAGPYIVFLTVYYLVDRFRRPAGAWKEISAVALASGLLLGTWFVWSVAVFGAGVTAKSNTSVVSSQEYKGSNLAKIGLNLVDSVVPALLRQGPSPRDQGSSAGWVRDNAFMFYQVNLIFAMGLMGGPLVLWLLYRTSRRGPPKPKEWRFWSLLIPICVVMGIAVVGERDPGGTAHLTLVPLEMLGISLLAATFPWRRAAAIAILAGCAVDFGLGIFLQTRVEALENTPDQRVFSVGVNLGTGRLQPAGKSPERLSMTAWGNWYWKHEIGLERDVLAQMAGYQPANAAEAQALDRVRATLNNGLQADARIWHGWWERHGNNITFLGDAVAGLGAASLPPLLSLVFFAGLTVVMGRAIAPQRKLRTAPAHKVVPGGRKKKATGRK